jgi:hypothetical protein
VNDPLRRGENISRQLRNGGVTGAQLIMGNESEQRVAVS